MKKILLLVCVLRVVCFAQYVDFWQGEAKGTLYEKFEFNALYQGLSPTVVTFDVPALELWDQPCTILKWDKDSFNISLNDVDATFFGKKERHDSVATGFWKLNGVLYPLTLVRSLQGTDPIRPQNPLPPYPYIVEELLVPNLPAGVYLSATLTMPSGVTPTACVIVVSDKGMDDRDGWKEGHRPFWVMADYLARRGIAVLRYDDRGAFRSTGSVTAGIVDIESDLVAIKEVVKERTGLTDSRIGFMGWGEGNIPCFMLLRKTEMGFLINNNAPLLFNHNDTLLAGLNEPVLSLYGEYVPTRDAIVNLRIFQKYCKNNPNSDMWFLPGVNERLQPCTDNSVGGSGKTPVTFATQVLDIMVLWLQNLFKN